MLGYQNRVLKSECLQFAINLLQKYPKYFATPLGHCQKWPFLRRTAVDTFGENWDTFYSNIWSRWTP